MADALGILDQAIQAVTKLRKTIGTSGPRQVWSADERSLAKAAGFAWFRSYRPSLAALDSDLLTKIDARYRDLTEFAEKATTRDRYNTSSRIYANCWCSCDRPRCKLQTLARTSSRQRLPIFRGLFLILPCSQSCFDAGTRRFGAWTQALTLRQPS
jgi:hypothetical protein